MKEAETSESVLLTLPYSCSPKNLTWLPALWSHFLLIEELLVSRELGRCFEEQQGSWVISSFCSPQHYSVPYGGSLLLSHAQNDGLGLQESWCAGR